MTTNDDQKPMATTEADSTAGVSCGAASGSVAVVESWVETVSRYIDEERLHDDDNSFLEMDGPLLQVGSSKYGSHYFRVTLTPITSEEYFAPRSPQNGGG